MAVHFVDIDLMLTITVLNFILISIKTITIPLFIHVREIQRGNQEWTIQKNW